MNHLSVTTPLPAMRLDIHGAFVRRANLNNTNLENANLADADAQGALFQNANFKNANLEGTDLRGADLTGATNLTVEQLRLAIVDENTLLPDNIKLADVVGKN